MRLWWSWEPRAFTEPPQRTRCTGWPLNGGWRTLLLPLTGVAVFQLLVCVPRAQACVYNALCVCFPRIFRLCAFCTYTYNVCVCVCKHGACAQAHACVGLYSFSACVYVGVPVCYISVSLRTCIHNTDIYVGVVNSRPHVVTGIK